MQWHSQKGGAEGANCMPPGGNEEMGRQKRRW